MLWDEAANTGQVPNLEKLVAVIRSREVSLTLFYQAQSQCKAIYKDNAETIIPFVDHFPQDTELYTLLTTKPEDKANGQG